MTQIRRAYVTVGARQIHVRHAGEGPAVVLIHQSPTSARVLDVQTAAFGRAGFSAFALDIPGLGRSDPVAAPRPEIEDLACGLAETLDAMGLEQVALYGSHTGALACTEFAVRWPARVSALLIDGYPIYSEDERARRVATYFPPYELRWDGAHLLWLWARYREQYLFWPWNIPARVTQARCDVPSPEFLHEGVIDLLRAGNGYRIPYAAAFRCRSAELVPRLRVPTYFLAYPDDSLTANLALFKDLPANCRVEPMPLEREAGTAKEIAILRRHAPASTGRELRTADRPYGITRNYVNAQGLQLGLRTAGPKDGQPLVVLPPAPGSASMLAAEIEQLAATRRVIAIDAPGCGDSDAPAQLAMGEMAEAVGAALGGLGLRAADAWALHGGCQVAAALVARGALRRAVLESPARRHADGSGYLADYAPAIVPRWDGTHLVSLWHVTRNRRLFRPWFDQRLAARDTGEPMLDVESLNQEVLAGLESWRSWHLAWRAVLQAPLPASSPALRLASRASDEFRLAVTGEELPEPVVPRTRRILALLDA